MAGSIGPRAAARARRQRADVKNPSNVREAVSRQVKGLSYKSRRPWGVSGGYSPSDIETLVETCHDMIQVIVPELPPTYPPDVVRTFGSFAPIVYGSLAATVPERASTADVGVADVTPVTSLGVVPNRQVVGRADGSIMTGALNVTVTASVPCTTAVTNASGNGAGLALSPRRLFLLRCCFVLTMKNAPKI